MTNDEERGPRSVSPLEDASPCESDGIRSRRQTLHEKRGSVAQRLKTGQAAQLYARLNAVDFMNSAFPVFRLDVDVFVPGPGGDYRAHRRRYSEGDRQPDGPRSCSDERSGQVHVVGPHHALASLGVLTAVFLALSAISIASTLQAWYPRINNLPKLNDWKRQTVYRLVWFAGFVLQIWLLAWVGLRTGPAGGKVLIFLCRFAISTVFWWWSMYLLLQRRIPWRSLLPSGLATAFCLTGLGVFSALLFSGSVVSDQKSYGSVGRNDGDSVVPHRIRCVHPSRCCVRPSLERRAPGTGLTAQQTAKSRQRVAGKLSQPG